MYFSIAKHTVAKIEHWMNHYPRRIFNFKCHKVLPEAAYLIRNLQDNWRYGARDKTFVKIHYDLYSLIYPYFRSPI